MRLAPGCPRFVWGSGLLFLALSALLLWPLPLHLWTHLPGDPSGDLGVYVWNLWIFRHELVDHAHAPVSTDHLFADMDGDDFSLHNYTPLAGLVATPLMGVFGVVGTFNAVLILIVAASGFTLFLVARKLGLRWPGAMLAGGLFVAAPVVNARASAHLSLVTTAPLPLFLWALLRVLDGGTLWRAVLVGVVAAIASYADAYFGIYCACIGLFTVSWRFLRVDVAHTMTARAKASRHVVTALLLSLCAVIAARVAAGPTTVVVGPLRIGLETLYTPMLAATLLLVAAAWITWRPRVRLHDPDGRLPGLVRLGGVAIGTCLLLMLPMLGGLLQRALTDGLPETEIYWRSSPRGVDLLAYVVPNPLHPWFGASTSQWFMPAREDAFPEFVAAFPLVALAAIGLAWRWRALPSFWLGFTGLFAWLSLGPFVHVAGINTYVPGPWAFLRYLPLLGMARAPSRFAILAALGLSVLAGFALQTWLARERAGRRTLAACVIALLVVELVPIPRPLFSADVPDVYRLITAGDESTAVLNLPTGLRDGTSSIGNFSAQSQFFQTRHRRPLVGGYLSRISRNRKERNRRNPMMRLLTTLSEGQGPVSAEMIDEARPVRERFLARSCVGFVVIDKQRTSEALRTVATDVLQLVRVHEDDRYELLRPVDPPECLPRRQRGHGARSFRPPGAYRASMSSLEP